LFIIPHRFSPGPLKQARLIIKVALNKCTKEFDNPP
jgi:hypothetical protein